jgi:hypothetical protein
MVSSTPLAGKADTHTPWYFLHEIDFCKTKSSSNLKQSILSLNMNLDPRPLSPDSEDHGFQPKS